MSESDEYPRLPPTHGDDTWRRLDLGRLGPADDDDAPDLDHDAMDGADPGAETPHYHYGGAYDADDPGEYGGYDPRGDHGASRAQANGSGHKAGPNVWADQAEHDGEPLGEFAGPDLTSDTVKIGLWGSPMSGKTTFLAALRHATATAQGNDCGIWGIFPVNTVSRNLLVDLTQELTQGRFPPATPPGARSEFKWLFVGDLSDTRFARRGRLRRRMRTESRFELDMIDVSGKAFGYDPDKEGGSLEDARIALDHLAAADGLIYLFDPLGERDNGDSTNYVNRTIGELRHRYSGRNGPHMPQHVSICVTKFDHPEVFQEARRLNLVSFGSDGMPRVPDESAEEFFNLLCTGKFWSEKYEQGDRSAWFVRNELRNAFGKDKIEYFVTSSIGFWRQPGWTGSVADFDPEDFANFRVLDGGTPSIRGTINPVNVLEPLIRLQQRVLSQSVPR